MPSLYRRISVPSARSSASVPFPAKFIGGAVGDYWIGSDLTRLFTDSAETANVASNGDPIGSWKGQLDAFSITQAVAGNKPLWNAADNSVRLPYYKFLDTLVGGTLFAAGEESSLLIYAKLVDFGYGASGDSIIEVFDGSGYMPIGLHTGGYFTGLSHGQIRYAKNDGSAQSGGYISFPESEPVQTDFRAVAYSRSGSADTRGAYAHNTKYAGDPDYSGPYERDSNITAVKADGNLSSFKIHVKMIVAARKGMSSEDVAGLIDYAESLP